MRRGAVLLGLASTLILQGMVKSDTAIPPCEQLLSNVQKQRPGSWSATLTIPVPDQPNAAAFGGWHLRLTFTQPVDTLKHNGAGVTMSTVDDRNFILRLPEGDPGRKLILELKAQHSASEMGVSLVNYNNMPVCKTNAPEPTVALAIKKHPACPDLLENVNAHMKTGEWTAVLNIIVPDQPNAAAFRGWHLKLVFNQPIKQLTHNVSGATTTTVDDRNFIMRSPRGNAALSSGDRLVIKLHVKHDEKHVSMLSAVNYNNMLICNGTLHYDYAQALSLTLLFLESQQSGALPGDQRVPWRGDSCMNDRGMRGEDLTGGYFTGSAGRTVKFTFPNAAANTMLAWGMIVHEAAYEQAGELINGMAAVDWGARYLSRCYTPQDEVYAIVGDHMKEPTDFWCRPEDINYARPTLALSPDNPGSDLFGEVVAALAASSVVLKNHWEGPHISAGYLSQAKRLFEMAAENRGDYLRAMQLLTWDPVYTPRNGDECELIWAATWMYRATSEPRYLQLAQKFYKKLNFRKRPFTFFYWDDKAVGAMILLYQITKSQEYAIDARIFCDTITQNASLHTASGVLRGIGDFASGLQLGAWASFACVELGETLVRYGAAESNPYTEFALRHIHYILGDTGRSFLVGYGKNYPLRPKDIASLCGPPPSTCGQTLFESDKPNYHTLHGALVFGPDMEGHYTDSRLGVHNNVDIVANTGLSSALAALLDLRTQGKIQ